VAEAEAQAAAGQHTSKCNRELPPTLHALHPYRHGWPRCL
jgi:hypothetical protein